MAVSRAILEGRWRKLQRAMAADGLGALVMAGRGRIAQFGYVVYLCDYTPVLRSSYGVLWPEGAPTLLVPSRADRALVSERGLIDDVRSSGEGDAMRGELSLAGVLAGILRDGGAKRVGIAGLGDIVPVNDYLALRHELPGLEILDATALAAAAKAHKDPWELAQVSASLSLAAEGYAAAIPHLRPGGRARDAIAAVERVLRGGGASEMLVFVDSTEHSIRRTTDTVFRPGDLVTVLVEVANVDGFWTELGGLFALGTPSPEADRLATACYEALDGIRSLATPGTPVGEAFDVFARVAAREGLDPGLGLGHGVGIDHDLPSLALGAAGTFEEGHVVSVHPNYQYGAAGLGATVADAFHVTAMGARRLSQLPYELTVL
jgi:Xaa-Pro aminopeptidase